MSGQREIKAEPLPLQSNKELNTRGWKQKEDVSHQLTQQSRARFDKIATVRNFASTMVREGQESLGLC